MIVAALNMKGGVGKTSTCHHLAGTLAAAGRRVLLVDNDPQASLTQGFWGPVVMGDLDPSRTIAAVYGGLGVDPAHVIRPTGVPGIDLVPGSEVATDYNTPRPQDADLDLQTALRGFLAEASPAYDITLIDCPPNLHLCSWAALAAATHLLVPLQAEDYGAQGLGPVRRLFQNVRTSINADLRLLGYLVTMYNARASIHKLHDEKLRQKYGDQVFATRIPLAIDFKEAISLRKTIADHKPRGASAKAMRALADELMGRLVMALGEAA